MTSNPKAPEAMEWQQDEGDPLSRTSAPSVETTHTQLAQLHSSNQAPRSPGLSVGFLAKYGKTRHSEGCRTPEPTSDPSMHSGMERQERILGRFVPKLTESQDEQRLSVQTPRKAFWDRVTLP